MALPGYLTSSASAPAIFASLTSSSPCAAEHCGPHRREARAAAAGASPQADLLRHAAIQYGQGGDAVVAGRGRRRDIAAERKTEQAEPAGAVGPRKDRG